MCMCDSVCGSVSACAQMCLQPAANMTVVYMRGAVPSTDFSSPYGCSVVSFSAVVCEVRALHGEGQRGKAGPLRGKDWHARAHRCAMRRGSSASCKEQEGACGE